MTAYCWAVSLTSLTVKCDVPMQTASAADAVQNCYDNAITQSF